MSEIVDIAEGAKKYENEWLLFEVTELDDLSEPILALWRFV